MTLYLTSFINKVVLFRVSSNFMEECKSLLQTQDKAKLLYGRLVIVDSVGCWVENRTWQTIDAKTNEKRQHNVHILIPWNALISVATFPDRTFDGDPEKDDFPDVIDVHRIGFLADIQ